MTLIERYSIWRKHYPEMPIFRDAHPIQFSEHIKDEDIVNELRKYPKFHENLTTAELGYLLGEASSPIPNPLHDEKNQEEYPATIPGPSIMQLIWGVHFLHHDHINRALGRVQLRIIHPDGTYLGEVDPNHPTKSVEDQKKEVLSFPRKVLDRMRDEALKANRDR
jgi:hypothetical protein